ncbi:MAG: MBL fold metallo-hydrolase [Candidatus Buchananbacteria bacterium]|nr:MBL fold metallo-hydrolase [Candidatus Buchananbacteria bacterium]
MIISWFGQSCFRIQGQDSVVVTDPFSKEIGLRLPKLTADILTISHDHHDHNNIEAVKGITTPEAFLINQPGEYEVKNTFVYGISSFHDNQQGQERGKNIIYRFEMENITITHLGDLGHSLENGLIEALEGTDILLLPVGGIYTINLKQAVEIVSQLEPRIVIPMHYNLPGLKLSSKIDGVEAFCKEMGVGVEAVDKFKVTKKDLPQEDLQVVILKP